jgi:hypothetical protein
MVFDAKLNVYACFNTHSMAVKSCIVLSDPDRRTRLMGLTWFTFDQLMRL